MLEFYLSLADDTKSKQKIELIYNEYKSFMMGVSMKILRDQHLASESVQDTMIKLIKNIDRIDDVLSDRTKSFIYIVTVNTAKTKLKKEKRNQAVDFDLAEKITVSEKDTFGQVFLDEILEMILKLPAIYREPLELSVYYGFSSKEIAALLGISDSLVRKRISKAREQLREVFEREGIMI